MNLALLRWAMFRNILIVARSVDGHLSASTDRALLYSGAEENEFRNSIGGHRVARSCLSGFGYLYGAYAHGFAERNV